MLSKLRKYLAVLILFQVILFYFGSAQTDSTLVSEKSSTVSVQKTEVFYNPIKLNGSAFSDNHTYQKIHKSDAVNQNYLAIHDIIENQTLCSPFFTNNFGKKDKIFLNGYFTSNSTFNGAGFTGNSFSHLNFWKLSYEQFENIEILEGATAIGYSANTGGTHYNFQEITYNSAKPFVRLWASDYDDNLLSFDGTWAKNILPNTNIYFGYRSTSANGEFDNSDARSRNLRFGIRHTMDSTSQINLTYLHSNHYLESNFGIDADLSSDADGLFSDDPFDARSIINSMNRREKDHKIFINYFKSFNKGILNNIQANISNRVSLIDENIGDFYLDTIKNILNEYSENTTNLFITSELELGSIFLKPTLNFANINSGSSYFFGAQNFQNWDIGSFAKLRLRNFNIYSSARLVYFRDKSMIDYGAGFEFPINSTVFKVDYSQSNKNPNLFMPTNEPEKHNLIFIEAQTNVFNLNTKIKVWNRVIENQHLFNFDADNLNFSHSNNSLNIIGAGIQTSFTPFQDLAFNKDFLDINLKILYNSISNGISPVPKLFVNINPNFRIPVGRSEANLGFIYNYSSAFQGYAFNSFFDIYSVNTFRELPEVLLNYELYARFRLNHAWLKISIENFFSADVYNLAWHPSYDAMFKLSFNWTIR